MIGRLLSLNEFFFWKFSCKILGSRVQDVKFTATKTAQMLGVPSTTISKLHGCRNPGRIRKNNGRASEVAWPENFGASRKLRNEDLHTSQLKPSNIKPSLVQDPTPEVYIPPAVAVLCALLHLVCMAQTCKVKMPTWFSLDWWRPGMVLQRRFDAFFGGCLWLIRCCRVNACVRVYEQNATCFVYSQLSSWIYVCIFRDKL